jgi:hypothetical protein
MNIQTINANSYGVLVSTTDLKKASKLGKRFRLKSFITIEPVHYKKTEEGTILIDDGRELYELNINF